MDIFGGEWVGHAEKLYNNWTESVTNDDIVIVCGDISWGLRLDEAVADLEWIHNLPGTKVFSREIMTFGGSLQADSTKCTMTER